MKIKPGVWMPGLQREMQPALIAAEMIWRNLGDELVITSALDGEHSAGSLHYYGYALDLRTFYFNEEQKEQAASLLRAAVGGDYDVVTHESHIHIEYDQT